MFMADIVLGIVTMIYSYFVARKNGYKVCTIEAPVFKDKAKVFWVGSRQS